LHFNICTNRSKDCEADEKRHEHERLMMEALALEAAKEEIQRKEDERQRKKQNGSVLLTF